MPTHQPYAIGGRTLTRDETRGVFGQVMGLVALTVGCTALGSYVGRSLSGGTSLIIFVAAFACIFGLQFASSHGHEQLAVALLFGLGLLLGMAVGPALAVYARSDPAALWQSAGATAAFVAALGSYGYATRRALSASARWLFFALLGLIVIGIATIFIAIPGGNVIYAVLGLAVFRAFTAHAAAARRAALSRGQASSAT